MLLVHSIRYAQGETVWMSQNLHRSPHAYPMPWVTRCGPAACEHTFKNQVKPMNNFLHPPENSFRSTRSFSTMWSWIFLIKKGKQRGL